MNFKDQTPGAVAWQWNFNAYGSYNGANVQGTSNLQAPSYTYTTDGDYLVWLQATNGDGCSAITYQGITINSPSVGITEGSPTVSSCTSLLTNTFGTFSTQPLKTTNWNFGDGTTSTAPNPTHTFKNIPYDSYTITLNYTTVNGCTGSTQIYQFGIIPEPVNVSAAAPSLATCLSPITATFAINSQDPLITTHWAFGDGDTSSAPSPTHTYTSTGTYVATLNYVTQAGCKGSATANPVIIDPKVKLSFARKSKSRLR